LPLTDMAAAAAEFERVLGLSGMIGAQLPGNLFLTRDNAEAARPLLAVANRHKAVVFIHHGPRPGDAFPKVAGGTDNARRRNGTLDMQACLSSVMVTLCLTDLLADYPDATVVVHNLGGNIPYEVERMDHRCLLDTPDEELPSTRFRRAAAVYVDCNSFGPRAIEAAMAGSDVVFHLAVQCVRRSLGEPLHNHEVNATGTLNVLETARRRRVRRFIYCSSSEVYGNYGCEPLVETATVCEPATVYGAAKLAGEHYAKAYWQTYGLPTIVVRPFNTYGPREHTSGDLAEVIPRFVIRVLNGLPPVIFGTGENGRDFTYVTETVRGIALAAGCDALVGRGETGGLGQLEEGAERLQARIEVQR